jgi:phage terminase large subunit-like protein
MDSLSDDLKIALNPVLFARLLGFNPDPWQEKVLSSSSKRLMLNCSRQSGKSTTASILALHRAIFYPENLILLVSPSLRQSSELFRKVGEQLKKLQCKPKLVEDNKLSCTLDNKSRIVSLPSSEGTIRGYSGASLIIEDEASRVDDELYRAIRPMLAVSNGRLILMSTPFGKRGHFYKEWSEGEGWEKIQIKADDCPRISKEFLESERRSLGEWWFKQEYMCEFMDSVDSAFRTEEIRRMFEEEFEQWEL